MVCLLLYESLVHWEGNAESIPFEDNSFDTVVRLFVYGLHINFRSIRLVCAAFKIRTSFSKKCSAFVSLVVQSFFWSMEGAKSSIFYRIIWIAILSRLLSFMLCMKNLHSASDKLGLPVE